MMIILQVDVELFAGRRVVGSVKVQIASYDDPMYL
jgi:hypothetical protein